jgi:RND family efflux transporter MFP subunit
VNDRLSTDLASLRIDREPSRPRRGGGVVRALVVLVLLGGLLAAGVAAYPRVEQAVFKTEVKVAQITSVSPAQASVKVTSTGYVVPQVVSDVGARIPGRVAEVMVKEGDVVEKGAVLARLEDVDSKSALNSAQTRVTTARANVEVARANLAEVRLQLERVKKLVEKGAAPAAELENLEAREKAMEAQVRAAEASVKSTAAEAKTLSVAVDDHVIVSPIAGTVVRKPVAVGELVGVGLPITRIADFGTLLVETDVPEARLYMVKQGGPCEVVLDAYPTKRYRGEAVEIGKQVDRAKATVKVKVRILDDQAGVLADMAARVSFLSDELSVEAAREPPRVVVPLDAVVDRDGQKVVFTMEDGVARKISVQVGEPFGGGLELLQGPPVGTLVVSAPPATLKDGQAVKQKED